MRLLLYLVSGGGVGLAAFTGVGLDGETVTVSVGFGDANLGGSVGLATFGVVVVGFATFGAGVGDLDLLLLVEEAD